VLYWGILGALAMRAAMILAGAFLLHRFHWMLCLFGGFLILPSVRMLPAPENPDLGGNLSSEAGPALAADYAALRRARLYDTRTGQAPVYAPGPGADPGGRQRPGLRRGFDPGHLRHHRRSLHRIWQQRLRSSRAALVGRRSLYFALAGILAKFHYLKISLAVLMALIGVKMLLKDVLHGIPHLTY
jgi:tellurite resistance protein TerC